MVVSHGECVVKMPPNSELIGTSDSCTHEIFVTGEKRNLLCCQSHPEFADEDLLKYAIYDRIAPVVIDEKKRLDAEQAKHAMDSFAKFTGEDSRQFMKWVSHFLHN